MEHPKSMHTPRGETRTARNLEGAMLWVASAGFIVGGVGATAVALLLPSTESGLRVAATCLGLFLTSVGGVIASYGITRSATAREQEAAYHAYLSGVARSIAHVYSTLHEATENRRSGVYAHEETYLESVIMSAEALLTQYDGLTQFSGSIGSDLIDSKAELNTIRKGLYDHSTTDAVVSLVKRSEPTKDDPVVVQCPRCRSRVHASLALRAGWTAHVVCSYCRLRFNIHRRPDMSVYASPPKNQEGDVGGGPWLGRSSAQGSNEVSLGAESPPGARAEHQSGLKVIHSAPSAADQSEVRSQVLLTCPECGDEIRVNLLSTPPPGRSSFVRTCLACRIFLMISPDDFSITATQPANCSRGTIVDRDAAFPVVACLEDAFPMKATFHRPNDSDWYAVCVVHRCMMMVTRSDYRGWLQEHDPEFYATRLGLEQSGGKRVITDEPMTHHDEAQG